MSVPKNESVWLLGWHIFAAIVTISPLRSTGAAFMTELSFYNRTVFFGHGLVWDQNRRIGINLFILDIHSSGCDAYLKLLLQLRVRCPSCTLHSSLELTRSSACYGHNHNHHESPTWDRLQIYPYAFREPGSHGSK